MDRVRAARRRLLKALTPGLQLEAQTETYNAWEPVEYLKPSDIGRGWHVVKLYRTRYLTPAAALETTLEATPNAIATCVCSVPTRRLRLKEAR